MMRLDDKSGDSLIWCSRCAGYVENKMSTTLLNVCQSQKVVMMDYEKKLRKIPDLEDGRVVPCREAED